MEPILKRDRIVVMAGILAVAALAWAYLVYLAQSNDGMGMGLAMAQLRSWSVADFGLMFLMWAVMMTAMMVPSAAPMILLFATVNRRRREQEQGGQTDLRPDDGGQDVGQQHALRGLAICKGEFREGLQQHSHGCDGGVPAQLGGHVERRRRAVVVQA